MGLLDFKSSGGQLTWPRWVRFPRTPANTFPSAPEAAWALALRFARTCARADPECRGIMAFAPDLPKARLAMALLKSQLVRQTNESLVPMPRLRGYLVHATGDQVLNEASRTVDFLGRLNWSMIQARKVGKGSWTSETLLGLRHCRLKRAERRR